MIEGYQSCDTGVERQEAELERVRAGVETEKLPGDSGDE